MGRLTLPLVAFLAVLTLASPCRAQTVDPPTGDENTWYPQPVEARDPPFNPQGTFTRFNYMPLGDVSRRWRLCASVPPSQLDYVQALIYGLESEAARQNVRLALYQEEGGVEQQVERLANCLDQEFDALILVAAAADGFASILARARARGVPVVDLASGVASNNVRARIVADAVSLGRAAGRFLADRHPPGSEGARIVWFPGPADARFAEDADRGFRAGIARGAIEIVATEFAPLDIEAMRQRLRRALDEHADLTAVAGLGLISQLAAEELAVRTGAQRIDAVSITVNDHALDGIRSGWVAGAVNDRPIIQARIAVDIALRALEEQPFMAELRPRPQVIDSSNVETFDRSTTIPPTD